ncbi:hypothetical protein [Pseudogemmobacter bohemicus]|uniref:hypothetical protein n=1 Tax=Pseudogemmobacter bohemicus TaxID=2250708 RepID=UPI000DD43B6A|nr:hypothetical protein [Pseudogemmobacter bohemicus]
MGEKMRTFRRQCSKARMRGAAATSGFPVPRLLIGRLFCAGFLFEPVVTGPGLLPMAAMQAPDNGQFGDVDA